ncbi:response regulator [Maribellus maritimus]|uniref:response regulator n=1 Tax=Maribellus maritimus TaxID=2870838 RepID=UPI001EEB6960|nr:response regulator [Maribellus maritimus]MCG6187234.1 response regulator [Maribellus maritimus]
MKKILAIDDQKVNLTDLKIKIKFISPDIEFLGATCPKKGLELALTEKPDIIILDIMMPGIDGYEVCSQLKSNELTESIPVIFLTVLDNNRENRIKAIEVGGDAFLSKPVDDIELRVQINAMLKISESCIKRQEEKLKLEKLVEKRTYELKRELEKRRETEIRLRENEKKYRELVESSPDIIYIISSKEGVTFGAKRVTEILGIQQEDFKKNPFLWLKLVHPDDQDMVKKITDTNFKETSFDIEYRIKDAKNNWHWFRDRSISRHIQNDEVIVQGIATDITKRKLAEQKLKENEKERQRITDNIPGVVYQLKKYTTGEVNFTFLGSKSISDIELTEEEVKNNPNLFYKSVHPEDLEKLIKIREESIKNNEPFQIDVRFIKSDDSIVWLRVRSIPETLDDGTVSITGIAMNISENKHAEEKIRESEEKYRLLITQMAQGLAVHEGIFDEKGKMTDYRFVDFNNSFETQTGLKRNETIGKSLFEIFPNFESYWIENYEKVLQTGNALHFENYAAELGKYFEVIAYKIRENQFATVVTDVTEKKRDFKELCLHNQRQEVLLKIFRYNSNHTRELLNYALKEAIHLTESKHGILFLYNENSKQITIGSCSKQFTNNKQVPDVVYELEQIGIWGEAAKKRSPITLNNTKLRKDTFKCVSKCNYAPKNLLAIPVIVKDDIKAIIGVSDKAEGYNEKDIKQISLLIEAAWTVIERSRHIEELRRAKERAEESDRLKSAFLANMSHEIRTPMNGIMGFAELLKNSQLTEEEQQSYLSIIEKSGERMLNTINDLIDISRIESNLVEVNFSEFNINEQMIYLYHFFKLETKNKGLQLNYKTTLLDGRALIISDKDKVNAILMNLIKNSIKYTNQGEIEFGYSVKDNFLEFYVNDTGVGVQKDRQEAIFERFVQADVSISRPYEGVGLGLSIAKAYVEMLHGTIGIESEEGKGSHFYFRIPYKTNTIHFFDNSSSNFTSAVDSENVLKEMTILVAEDDETGRMYMEQMLDGKCKKVIFAKNGTEAVECYENNHDVDLVLMDMKMPEMDGYTATKKIKGINGEVLIIGQSAFALPGDREKSIAAGCDDYLTKPLDKNKLFQTVYKHFKNSVEIH